MSSSEKIQIKGEFVGHVIGKGGQRIKEIREKSGKDIKIDIPKDIDPKAMTTITVSGEAKGVGIAAKEIRKVIEEREKALARDGKLYDGANKDVEKHAQLRDKYFQEAKEAFEKGDKAKAKELSDKGKAEAEKFEAAKKDAARKVFNEKNKKNAENVLDLHGLQREAAMGIVEESYVSLKASKKFPTMQIIPGAGIHSDGDAKLKADVLAWAKGKNVTLQEVQNGVFELKF